MSEHRLVMLTLPNGLEAIPAPRAFEALVVLLPEHLPVDSLVMRLHTARGDAGNTANGALLECLIQAGKAWVSALGCCFTCGTDGLVEEHRRRFGRVADGLCNRSPGHLLPILTGRISVHVTEGLLDLELAGGGRRAWSGTGWLGERERDGIVCVLWDKKGSRRG